MTHYRKRRSAEELLKEIEADPVRRERQQRMERAHEALMERVRAAEAPVVGDLHAVGVKANSVWDLVNTRAKYPAAIPVLLEHLQRDYIPEVREGIARALGVPEASWAWDLMLELFRREPEGGARNVKWALATALGGAASDGVTDTLIELVRDPSIGENRLALLRALLRASDPRARRTLEELRNDPQLKKELRFLLGRPTRRE